MSETKRGREPTADSSDCKSKAPRTEGAANRGTGGKRAGAGAREGAGSEVPALQRYVQILGTDAGDCCPSVLVVTESGRFLFNAGDGLQRFCTQHAVKLGKLEDVFLTQLHADTLGGLLGMYLTLADGGNRRLSVHGPRGISHFLSAGRAFCDNRKHSELCAVEIDPQKPEAALIRANHVSIQPVPVACSVAGTSGTTAEKAEAKSGQSESDEETGAAAAGMAHPETQGDSGGKVGDSGDHRDSGLCRNRRHGVEGLYDSTAVSYVLRFADEAGKLDVKKAQQLGVPLGKLLGELKSGRSVTLSDGRVVEPSECSPVVLGEESAGGGKVQAGLIVHFSSRQILCDARYVGMVDRIAQRGATHILVHRELCVPEVVFPSQASMLALLRQECPDYFPSYPDAVSEEAGAGGLDILRQAGWSSGDGGLHAESKLEAGKIMMKFGVHPVRAAGLYLYTCPYTTLPAGHMQSELASPGNSPRQMREEAMGEEKTKPRTESETHAGLIGLAEGDVVVATLGTAASVPGKYRNVSGIYLRIRGRGGMLLDCGEGTLGQMSRYLATSRRTGVGEVVQGVLNALEHALVELKCVWISHMHADHHLGLLRILCARAAAVSKAGLEHTAPVTVVGPPALRKWLRSYSRIQNIPFDFVFNQDIHQGRELSGGGWLAVLKRRSVQQTAASRDKELCGKSMLANELGVCVSTVAVRHSCRDACGVIIEDLSSEVDKTPWKVVYSGDTRPCQELEAAGSGATLLIHEATFENSMEPDARQKQHSTTAEALRVGSNMGAYRTLLTHFSQRYHKVPVLQEVAVDPRAMVAFDLMSVDLALLKGLPQCCEPIARLSASQQWNPEDDETLLLN